MSLYRRKDSDKWWMWLEGAKPRSTGILHSTGNAHQDRENKAQALRRYHKEMGLLAQKRGGFTVEKEQITVKAHLQWYRAHVTAHKRGKDREAEILDRLTRDLGPLDLTDLTAARVREWMTARRTPKPPRKTPIAASTINRELDVLKHALAAAVPQYLDASPLRGVKRLHTPKKEPPILSRGDEAKILAQLPPADRAIVVCALDTLMRLGDIVNLRRDQDHRTYISVVDPKVAPYKVPVSTRLRQALNAVPVAGVYYFPHRRVAKNPRDWRASMKVMLRRACRLAGVPYGRKRGGITFHLLRHSGASRMVEAGTDLRTVQEIGGWHSLRQLQRYTHPTSAALKKAVETVK